MNKQHKNFDPIQGHINVFMARPLGQVLLNDLNQVLGSAIMTVFDSGTMEDSGAFNRRFIRPIMQCEPASADSVIEDVRECIAPLERQLIRLVQSPDLSHVPLDVVLTRLQLSLSPVSDEDAFSNAVVANARQAVNVGKFGQGMDDTESAALAKLAESDSELHAKLVVRMGVERTRDVGGALQLFQSERLTEKHLLDMQNGSTHRDKALTMLNEELGRIESALNAHSVPKDWEKLESVLSSPLAEESSLDMRMLPIPISLSRRVQAGIKALNTLDVFFDTVESKSMPHELICDRDRLRKSIVRDAFKGHGFTSSISQMVAMQSRLYQASTSKEPCPMQKWCHDNLAFATFDTTIKQFRKVTRATTLDGPRP
ncbi:hypothetical protein AB6D11_00030 [Vibrio splendidus]